MRTISSIVVILFILTGNANSQLIEEYFRSSSAIDIVYGTKIYTSKPWIELNTLKNFDMNLPIHFVGLEFNETYMPNRERYDTWNISYYHIIPEEAKALDFINGNISGNFLGCFYGTSVWRFCKKQSFINLGIGFNLGRTIYKYNYEEYSIIEKNSFIAPKVILQPRLRVYKFDLSLGLGFEYDISNHFWEEEVSRAFNLWKLNQSGISVKFSLGYNIYRI